MHNIANQISPAIFVLVTVLLSGCTHTLNINIRHHPNYESIYLVYYHPADKFLDQYGRGTENIRGELEAVNYHNHEIVWDTAYKEATEKYLLLNALLPEECVNGFKVTGTLPNESGGGTSSIQC